MNSTLIKNMTHDKPTFVDTYLIQSRSGVMAIAVESTVSAHDRLVLVSRYSSSIM